MISEYLEKRTIAASIYVISVGVCMWLKHIGEETYIDLLLVPGGLALIAACWFYLKAKNRSGAWLLLLPLNVIALLIFWSMEDCSNEEENILCPKCTAANFPNDSHCRLCKAPLGSTEHTVQDAQS